MGRVIGCGHTERRDEDGWERRREVGAKGGGEADGQTAGGAVGRNGQRGQRSAEVLTLALCFGNGAREAPTCNGCLPPTSKCRMRRCRLSETASETAPAAGNVICDGTASASDGAVSCCRFTVW